MATTLASEAWEVTSIYEMHLAFLQAEYPKNRNRVSPDELQALDALVQSADLSNAMENASRMRLLYHLRRHLLGEIPPDTVWHRVVSLREEHLSELCVISRCDWWEKSGSPQLEAAAMSKPREQLRATPDKWVPPILWGHDKNGPFTILEGNNRLVSYAATTQRPQLCIPVLIGLSRSRCIWHWEDKIAPVLNDLWKGGADPS